MTKHTYTHTLTHTDSHTIYTPHNIYGTQVHRYTVTEVQRYRNRNSRNSRNSRNIDEDQYF